MRTGLTCGLLGASRTFRVLVIRVQIEAREERYTRVRVGIPPRIHCFSSMIRDLRFDEIERADTRRRLVRLVVGCLLVSTAASYLVSREIKIREEHRALPEAQLGNLASLQTRHSALESMLAKHHVWTGAFAASNELDDLVVSIHSQETAMAKRVAQKSETETRIREEAESARLCANASVERHEYGLALDHLQRAIELADSLGDSSFPGGAWEHRARVMTDIQELEGVLGEGEVR